VCVGDADQRSIVESYQIKFIAQENNPASRKWNTGVRYLMEQNLDYVCVVGSDDILSTNLVTNIIAEMEKGTDLIYLDTIYFYAGSGQFRGHARKLVTKQILGVGRTISRRVIEATGTLWTRDRNWGMDGDCWKNISPHVKTKAVVEGIVVDVKTKDNLNSMNFWMSKIKAVDETTADVIYGIMGAEELQILNAL
jgi:Glycosyl transferase family 2.